MRRKRQFGCLATFTEFFFTTARQDDSGSKRFSTRNAWGCSRKGQSVNLVLTSRSGAMLMDERRDLAEYFYGGSDEEETLWT